MKHARPDSERTRLDTWLGPILPMLTWFRYQVIGRATWYSVLGESQHVVVGPMIPRTLDEWAEEELQGAMTLPSVCAGISKPGSHSRLKQGLVILSSGSGHNHPVGPTTSISTPFVNQHLP